MEKINDGGPAFPLPLGNEDIDPSVSGMTLRDYFAVKAMQGFCLVPGSMGIHRNTIVEASYAMADAMLKYREIK